MTIHTQLPIYKVAYDLLDAISDLTAQFPRNFRQATHGHHDRADLAKALRLRGMAVTRALTKGYWS